MTKIPAEINKYMTELNRWVYEVSVTKSVVMGHLTFNTLHRCGIGTVYLARGIGDPQWIYVHSCQSSEYEMINGKADTVADAITSCASRTVDDFKKWEAAP